MIAKLQKDWAKKVKYEEKKVVDALHQERDILANTQKSLSHNEAVLDKTKGKVNYKNAANIIAKRKETLLSLVKGLST